MVGQEVTQDFKSTATNNPLPQAEHVVAEAHVVQLAIVQVTLVVLVVV